MTSALDQLKQALQDMSPLVDLVQRATTNDAGFTYSGLDVTVVPPTVAGSIVLLVARFEEYLKEVVDQAFGQYASAQPPVLRTHLVEQVQLRIVSENFKTASRENIHGQQRSMRDRLNSIEAVAHKIVAGEIWGDDAVQTSGNPNSDTVKNLVKMLGIEPPWQRIDVAFQTIWQTRLQTERRKIVPRAADELDSVLVWRNSVAHSSSSLPLGYQELDDARAFVHDLSAAIDQVVQSETDARIAACGSAPATWA